MTVFMKKMVFNFASHQLIISQVQAKVNVFINFNDSTFEE